MTDRNGALSPEVERNLLHELYRREFEAFLEGAFRILEPNTEYIRSGYIGLICDRLLDVSDGDCQRLIVNCPPRHLKSFAISQAFPAWLLGQRPGMRIMLLSYGTDLVEANMRAIRKLMESPWYQRVFPGARLDPSKKSVGALETTKRGGVIGTTVEGQITGRGANLIIVDDPIKSGDAEYPNRLDALNGWFQHTALSRLNNKRTDSIIIVMQRLNVNDLTGFLLRGPGYTHLNLPAIAPRDETFLMRYGEKFVRTAGSALCPERQPLELLEQERLRIGSYLFSAQYLQEPVPKEGNILPYEHLSFVDQAPVFKVGDVIYQSWDLGVKDGDANDPSACVTVLKSGSDFYLLEFWCGRLLFTALRDKIISHARKFSVSRILIEDAANGPAMVSTLRETTDLNVISIPATSSKVERALAQAPLFEGRRVHILKSAPGLDEFVSQYRAFPKAPHDDLIDAVMQALAYGVKHFLGSLGFFAVGERAWALRVAAEYGWPQGREIV